MMEKNLVPLISRKAVGIVTKTKADDLALSATGESMLWRKPTKEKTAIPYMTAFIKSKNIKL